MTAKNTLTNYGSVSKFFHWTVFLLVIALLIVGALMGDIDDKGLKSQVVMIHKLIGLTVLGLMLLRSLWMLANPKPQLPPNTPMWELFAERTVHGLFYFLLIAMPLSGWIMSMAAGHPPHFFNLFTINLPGIPENETIKHAAKDIHEYIAWSLVALISLHVIAGLKHNYVDKDDVLKRMLPGDKS